jgi:hypothetical protein
MHETTDQQRVTAPATSKRKAGSRPGEAFTRRAITVILMVIAALTFAFSFGNTWAVGLRLGVEPWIAPLVGPAVDLSVIGLLAGIQYAVSHGVGLHQLRPARILLAFCGLATLALNIAEPLAQRDYGKAAFEVVGPILLLGWSEVGPALLREIHVANTDSPIPEGTEGESDPVERTAVSGPSRTRRPTRRSDQPTRSDHDLLERARQIDRNHRARHGRPISADDLRRELSIGSSRARGLVRLLRSSRNMNPALSPSTK